MSDVYSRAGADFGGSIAADAAKVVFAAAELDSSIGMLVQTLSLNYAQQISRIFEVGSQKTYYVAGRTQGQIGMSRIMGPRAIQLGFYRKFGNVCNAAENNINFVAAAGCQTSSLGGTSQQFGEGLTFTIKHAVITNIGININAQDMIVNEQVAMMFTSLNLGN
jgi:hypothetical protein